MSAFLVDVVGLGPTAARGVQYALAAVIVLVAILVAASLLLRMLRQGRGGEADLSRLTVVDVVRVDDKRRLVLVRRDDVEHLVLTGGGSDLLIETIAPHAAAPRHRIDPPIEARLDARPEPRPREAATEPTLPRMPRVERP